MGDRLHHRIPAEAWRAASAVLLTAPMTPLLFMGQEWAASTPFQYFTDLEPGLGRLVTEGRRREFAEFPEFSDPGARERIPDPQAASTFEASRLRWDERERPAHAAVLALYRSLLALRLKHPALGASDERQGEVFAARMGSADPAHRLRARRRGRVLGGRQAWRAAARLMWRRCRAAACRASGTGACCSPPKSPHSPTTRSRLPSSGTRKDLSFASTGRGPSY